jgi:hypothetical protein
MNEWINEKYYSKQNSNRIFSIFHFKFCIESESSDGKYNMIFNLNTIFRRDIAAFQDSDTA